MVIDPSESIDLARLTADVVHNVLPRAITASVVLSSHTSGPGPYVTGDRAVLGRAITAVLDNAVKFTPADGRIEVLLEREGRQGRIIVRDTGVGIPAEALPHIYEHFYRSEKAGERLTGGLGLGLAIARQILQAHGGDIDVQSAAGEGTTVTLTVPVDELAARVTAVRRAEPLSAGAKA